MGSCEGSIEVHELAPCVDEEERKQEDSCSELEKLADFEPMLGTETRQGHAGSGANPSSDNAGSSAHGDAMDGAFVDRRIGISEKLCYSESCNDVAVSNVGRDECLSDRKFEDRVVEIDQRCVENVGSVDRSKNSLGNFKMSSETMDGPALSGICNQEDESSSSSQGVAEDKPDVLADSKVDTSDKTVSLPVFEMPSESIPRKISLGDAFEKETQKEVNASEERIIDVTEKSDIMVTYTSNCNMIGEGRLSIETDESGVPRCIELKPSCKRTSGNSPTRYSCGDYDQQNELGHNETFDGPSTAAKPDVLEERDGASDAMIEHCSHVPNFKENADLWKEVSPETFSSCFVEKSVSSHPSCSLVTSEYAISDRSNAPGLSGKDVSGENDGCRLVDKEEKDHILTNYEPEIKFPTILSSYSRRSRGGHKSNLKTQTKSSTRKNKNTSEVAGLCRSNEIIFQAPKGKRSSLSKPARSSIWGSFANMTEISKLNGEPVPNRIKSHGSQKARVGRVSQSKRKCKQANETLNDGVQNGSSTGRITLRVKLGKGIGLSSLHGKLPEAIVNSAPTDSTTNFYGDDNKSYQETCLGIHNSAFAVEDKVGDSGTKTQLECFENSLEKVKTSSNNSEMYECHVNKELEGVFTSDVSASSTEEEHHGVPSHVEVKESGATIEKQYADSGTSPDSEVINSVADGQACMRSQDDFPDARVTFPGAFINFTNVASSKRGKKGRLLHTSNCPQELKSTVGTTMKNLKPPKKRGGRQGNDDQFHASEIPASSNNVNVLSNSSSSKECSMEGLSCSKETEVGGPQEGPCHDGPDDFGLGLSETENSKNLLPSAKSKGSRPSRKSDGVSKRRSKGSDSSRRVNGSRQRKMKQEGTDGNKEVENGESFHVIDEVKDDPETGNDIVADIGKTNACDKIESVDHVNLEKSFAGKLEESLAVDAWVHCDDCHKWRRIPVALADSIGRTNCRWICKDNMDKDFADCSIPQEKSNAEINAELGISDAEEDSYDFIPSDEGLECKNAPVCKEYEFTRISTNQFLHRSRKTQSIDEIMVCHCKPSLDGRVGCGDECLNRMLNIECIPGTCPCGDICSNQQFQKKNYAKMKWVRCGKKGFGLRPEEDISKGQFLIEYVGEVLDLRNYEARLKEYAYKGHKHFYFMTLDGSEVIDACAKGNLGRFINHSCDPNCRTEKWVVNGEICIGLFALRDIKKGEEVTFDYNYVRVVGAAAKKCYCGSLNCRGFIGGDPINSEVIDQVDSDEEFPEPVMLEDGEARKPASKIGSFDGSEIQFAETISEDGVERSRKQEYAAEINSSMRQSAPAVTESNNSFEMGDSKGETLPSNEAVDGGLLVESLIRETTSIFQGSEPSPSSVIDKSSSEAINVNKKAKSVAGEGKRVFVKSRFLIKSPRVKKQKPTSYPATNKSLVSLIKHKKLVEAASNGRFEAVQEKLNELLDTEGGISKRKDAPKGYLKLLVHTAASGASGNGEAIQSNRDISMILDALLKTKSRGVLIDVINKNGLRMLHNMMKQYRRDFKKIPILRKLLKVLEYLAVREILTLEHIIGGPPCPGMESFMESMLSLTEHDDKQVHQIARSFRDRWIPRQYRRMSYMDRNEWFQRGSNSNIVSTPQNHVPEQAAKSVDVTESSSVQSKTTSAETAVNDGSTAPSVGDGAKTRKRKSRWDQPAEERFASQHDRQKLKTGLLQQSESNEPGYCPHCFQNYQQLRLASSSGDASRNIHEDAPPPGFASPISSTPPGFSSPTNSSSNVSSAVIDSPPSVIIGYPQKFNSRLPVSYAIPLPIVQQFGSPQAGTGDGLVIAPGTPFHPFPPLPPFPHQKNDTPCTGNDSMVVDEKTLEEQSSHKEDNPSRAGLHRADMEIPGASSERTFQRSGRDSSHDLGRRYFRQRKWNRCPPWVRKRDGWESRGGMCSSSSAGIGVTNEHRIVDRML